MKADSKYEPALFYTLKKTVSNIKFSEGNISFECFFFM